MEWLCCSLHWACRSNYGINGYRFSSQLNSNPTLTHSTLYLFINLLISFNQRIIFLAGFALCFHCGLGPAWKEEPRQAWEPSAAFERGAQPKTNKLIKWMKTNLWLGWMKLIVWWVMGQRPLLQRQHSTPKKLLTSFPLQPPRPSTNKPAISWRKETSSPISFIYSLLLKSLVVFHSLCSIGVDWEELAVSP